MMEDEYCLEEIRAAFWSTFHDEFEHEINEELTITGWDEFEENLKKTRKY